MKFSTMHSATTKFAKLATLGLALVALVASLVIAAPAYATEAQLDHVSDAADLLTVSEEASLEAQAQAIEDEHGFGVYMVTVYDFHNYSNSSVFDAACNIYEEYTLGVGPGDDGLLLLLSMSERDYSLITYGDFGNYAFDDYARESLTEYFLDDFGNDSWYTGFADYLEVADLYIESAEAGAPYTYDNIIMTEDERYTAIAVGFGIILGLPLIIAIIVIAVLSAKMRSVAAATEAREYAIGGLELLKHSDNYVTTTKAVIRIANNSGGSSSIGHRGGFSGTSGKF